MSNTTSVSAMLKLDALMARPKSGKGAKPKGKMNRKLELPSFADQLALASSSMAGAAVMRDESATSVTSTTSSSADLDLRHLVKPKPREQSTTVAPPRRIKSALKKISSYGLMEEIGENIPISTNKNNWKNLPAPKLVEDKDSARNSTRDRKKALLQRAAASTPCLMPPNTTGKSFGKLSPTPPMKRKVSFNKIVVRDYNVTAGDGACRLGPPLALDWNYEEQEPVDVLDYEVHRREIVKPRSTSELRLNSMQRTMLLKYRAGLSEADIQAAAKEARKTHLQRSKTAKQSLSWMKLEDMMESATRKAKRLVACKASGSSSSSPNRGSANDLSGMIATHSMPVMANV